MRNCLPHTPRLRVVMTQGDIKRHHQRMLHSYYTVHYHHYHYRIDCILFSADNYFTLFV